MASVHGAHLLYLLIFVTQVLSLTIPQYSNTFHYRSRGITEKLLPSSPCQHCVRSCAAFQFTVLRRLVLECRCSLRYSSWTADFCRKLQCFLFSFFFPMLQCESCTADIQGSGCSLRLLLPISFNIPSTALNLCSSLWTFFYLFQYEKADAEISRLSPSARLCFSS